MQIRGGGANIVIVKARTAKKPPPRKKGSASAAPSARTAERAEGTRRDKVLETVLSEVTAEPDVQPVEEWVSVPCPYCGEEIEVHVTNESDGQTMYEDCAVCCRPISLFIEIQDGEVQVEAQRS